MATYSRTLRRGLPRVPGGEPWPPEGDVPEWVGAGADTGADVVTEPAPVAAPAEHVAEPAVASVGHVVRRGLPRVAGGDPWPAEGTLAGSAPVEPASRVEPALSAESVPLQDNEAAAPSGPATQPDATDPVAAPVTAVADGDAGPVRRGLPRVAGGQPWPAEGTAPAWTVKRAASEPVDAPEPMDAPRPVVTPEVTETPAPAPVAESPAAPAVAPPATPRGRHAAVPIEESDVSVAVRQPVEPAKPATKRPVREPVVWRGKRVGKWIQLALVWAVGAVVAAGMLVLAARGVTTLPGVPEWMVRYPGHYDLPDGAESGFPWWARWSHSLNIFLMALIIQSGLRIRNQQQPPAFYTPKKGGKKVSINLWLHTSLDVLWVVNGVAFVVLLFASGHWMRIVPTSWEVFPNALSAGLQYLTLEWPVENGWVNYNSLQQLMYFTIIFVAAPVAVVTGARMSEWWPQDAKINKWYPAPVARALHFPTMLFFVLFIIGHVALVFATGALQNLNHMFAGQDVVNWTGFWLFALTILITAGLLWAARPLVLAPIASLFGRVSNR